MQGINQWIACGLLESIWLKVFMYLPDHPVHAIFAERQAIDQHPFTYTLAIDAGLGEQVAEVFEAAAELCN